MRSTWNIFLFRQCRQLLQESQLIEFKAGLELIGTTDSSVSCELCAPSGAVPSGSRPSATQMRASDNPVSCASRSGGIVCTPLNSISAACCERESSSSSDGSASGGVGGGKTQCVTSAMLDGGGIARRNALCRIANCEMVINVRRRSQKAKQSCDGRNVPVNDSNGLDSFPGSIAMGAITRMSDGTVTDG